jgi:hypothetical protein
VPAQVQQPMDLTNESMHAFSYGLHVKKHLHQQLSDVCGRVQVPAYHMYVARLLPKRSRSLSRKPDDISSIDDKRRRRIRVQNRAHRFGRGFFFPGSSALIGLFHFTSPHLDDIQCAAREPQHRPGSQHGIAHVRRPSHELMRCRPPMGHRGPS